MSPDPSEGKVLPPLWKAGLFRGISEVTSIGSIAIRTAALSRNTCWSVVSPQWFRVMNNYIFPTLSSRFGKHHEDKICQVMRRAIFGKHRYDARTSIAPILPANGFDLKKAVTPMRAQ
jgi:hypothetical protein